MLVHRNSHFNIANMENEVYSERSMSMHSLCRILFFRCLIQSVVSPSAAASSFNKHSYKREDKIGTLSIWLPFRLSLSNSVIAGEKLPIG